MEEVRKFRFGNPVDTDALVIKVPESLEVPESIQVDEGKSVTLTFDLKDDDLVYGLGESVRGLNKRGWEYISWAEDDPEMTEDRRSLYGAHNFLVVDGKHPFGLFIDSGTKVHFDVGYTHPDQLVVHCPWDVDVYLLEGNSAYEIVKTFRKLIGPGFLPPKFAFGYGQSRWGYGSKEDLRIVADGLQNNHIPVDMVYMDIDYMDRYKDFSLSKDFQEDFPGFVQEMKERNIHLVPIIDAGVKVEPGDEIYDSGVAGNHFCKLEDGKTDFLGAVWPGAAVLPDFLNTKSRQWFGNCYRPFLEAGIDAFWNDMNEPALFYSIPGRAEVVEWLKEYVKDPDAFGNFELSGKVKGLKNSMKDYQRFYHNMDGRMIRHDLVHNLYGAGMVRAAREAFEQIDPEKRKLLFSRSSYVGTHRYGGIWTGDNKSWWDHILLLTSQLPGLNFCGFLYTGADLGGFGADTTEDLVLRFLQLGIFTPLMRNHSCDGTRRQEPYEFDHVDWFSHVIGVRYRLIPYLYSEFMKANQNQDLMFKPLSFVYPEDEMARQVQDQLMLGDELMIAPVYKQNALGRYVYLPEEMKMVAFLPDGTVLEEVLEKGHHYIPYKLNEVRFFIRKGKAIPIVDTAMSVPEIDMDTLQMIGYEGASYDLYDDDGISLKPDGKISHLTK